MMDAMVDEETGEKLCLFESGDDLIIFLLCYFILYSLFFILILFIYNYIPAVAWRNYARINVMFRVVGAS